MSDIKIVKADLPMVPALLKLSAQLGYERSADDISTQVEKIYFNNDHFLIAALQDGEVRGWAHFYLVDLITSLPYIEVGGLVVDQACHRQGLGRALMQAGEDWAMTHDIKAVRVRSRMQRISAHAFYERLGYECIKEQMIFLKTLQVKP
ncbi:MAG: GNAT family N-acetyltransferase [Anaerolineaceae bacterium]|nr:GNAT family N-acetyltransferase [Anaerolineaceae bacterium]